ncbi:hypothetical protein VSA01S_05980 [Vibrio sagamiensis NBRC 104589]|uniref:Uncharacterized protein n=1 Tax=Vibrio sagamiensis NBRC 104589 TaxID=1219064 RepID=A0A511QB79_9VIBR|nr:hypothetical protein VSA01S_05980 [Vibrio sagamiensis NBRC 104589]
MGNDRSDYRVNAKACFRWAYRTKESNHVISQSRLSQELEEYITEVTLHINNSKSALTKQPGNQPNTTLFSDYFF